MLQNGRQGLLDRKMAAPHWEQRNFGSCEGDRVFRFLLFKLGCSLLFRTLFPKKSRLSCDAGWSSFMVSLLIEVQGVQLFTCNIHQIVCPIRVLIKFDDGLVDFFGFGWIRLLGSSMITRPAKPFTGCAKIWADPRNAYLLKAFALMTTRWPIWPR